MSFFFFNHSFSLHICVMNSIQSTFNVESLPTSNRLKPNSWDTRSRWFYRLTSDPMNMWTTLHRKHKWFIRYSDMLVPDSCFGQFSNSCLFKFNFSSNSSFWKFYLYWCLYKKNVNTRGNYTDCNHRTKSYTATSN